MHKSIADFEQRGRELRAEAEEIFGPQDTKIKESTVDAPVKKSTAAPTSKGSSQPSPQPTPQPSPPSTSQPSSKSSPPPSSKSKPIKF